MKFRVILSAVLILAMASACSSKPATNTTTQSTETTTGGASVKATEKDFAISVTPSSATAGSVSFQIHNSASQTHQLMIFKTDLAEDALPLNSSGIIDKNGAGVTFVAEKDDIGANSDATLSSDLTAGKYVLVCNLPGHYKAGMHTSLTVS